MTRRTLIAAAIIGSLLANHTANARTTTPAPAAATTYPVHFLDGPYVNTHTRTIPRRYSRIGTLFNITTPRWTYQYRVKGYDRHRFTGDPTDIAPAAISAVRAMYVTWWPTPLRPA